MTRLNIRKLYELVISVLLASAVILLPITSLPILSELSGGATVVPISVPLFLIIGAAWFLPHIFRGGFVPLEAKPLLIFLLAIGFSWVLSLFLHISPYKDHIIISEGIPVLFTCLIAFIVFIVTASWISQQPERVHRISRWISLGGFILVFWSLVQAYVVLVLDGDYPRIIYLIQDQISARQGNLLFEDRVTGLAYEPSWLAHQLVLLYLPLWLSYTLAGTSAFRKLGRFSAENIALIFGIFNLFMTFSRIGWASFLLILGLLGIQLSTRIIKNAQKWLLAKSRFQHLRFSNLIISLGFFLLLGIGFLGTIVFLIWIGSKLEPRFAKILSYDFSEAKDILYLTNLLFFAERAVYWATGWNIFNHFPFLGVGLGNSGFLFPENMPSFGYGLTEIRDLFYRLSFLPNTKSLWIRLFAETGMVGVAIFISWIFVIITSTRLIKRIGPAELKMFGWMGQFVVIAFISEGFSLDSLAMPYFWFSMGLVSGVAAFARQDIRIWFAIEKTKSN